MNKYKKFSMYALGIILIFIAYHFIVFNLYTSQIFSRKDKLYVGDIARVSYQIDALYPRKLEYTMLKKHLTKQEYFNGKKVDILTIGDSFSNAATGGLNPYYQDYLATYYNKNVLNILDESNNRVNTFKPIIALYNNGWLKRHHVKTVIIQSVERFCYMRYAIDFDFDFNQINLNHTIRDAVTHNSYIPRLLFINNANFKLPYYNIITNFKHHFHTDVILLDLTKKLFFPKKFQNKLLIHNEDIASLPYYTINSVKKINTNFNKLAKLLKTIDIQLIFMPTVDKYDLYYNYIKQNPYSKNNFFELIRTLPKNYIFIDTKAMLTPLLRQGIKDVYYPDDTHWSYKAIEQITKNKIFKINLESSK